MIDALSLAAFTAGTQPHARGTRLDEVRSDAWLLPPGAVIVRTARDQNCKSLLGTGPGWTIRVTQWRNGGADVSVTAETAELAQEVLDLSVKDAAPAPKPDLGVVSMGFWHRSARRGPTRSARAVTAEAWADIRCNYPAAVYRLHPAVIRPGRCLAQVEVGPFPPAEAAQWLRDSGTGHQNVAFAAPVTLAELYALRGGRRGVAGIHRVPEAVGQYL